VRFAGAIAAALPILATSLAGPAASTPPARSEYHIVLARRAVGPGEHIELKIAPPPPAGARVNWSVASRMSGNPAGLQSATYRAPFVIPAGAQPALVTASISGTDLRASATTEIELTPGSVPGAEECLGPGQSFSMVYGELEPSYTAVDELPELIHSVPPDYPRSILAHGKEASIAVKALVCRSGRVLDAWAQQRLAGPPDWQPIEDDPKLADVAIASVRQYVFKPALASGQPIAAWVVVLVRFTP
jgi:hypothetical protein